MHCKKENIEELATSDVGVVIRSNDSGKIQLVFESLLLYYKEQDFDLVVDFILNYDVNKNCINWRSERRIMIQLARNSSMSLLTFQAFSELKNLLIEAQEYLVNEQALESLLREIA